MHRLFHRFGKEVPEYWEQFGSCLIFHFIVPLLPFFVEWMGRGKVSPETLTVGAAVYVMAIGASSRSMFLFALSVLLSIVYSVLFGFVISGNTGVTANAPRIVGWSVLLVVLIHLVERIKRHIVQRTPYLEFIGTKKEAP